MQNQYSDDLKKHWLVNNIHSLKSIIRIAFGAVWLVDGYLKFLGSPSDYAKMIQSAADGQPAWLQPWFSMWYSLVSSNPTFFVYSIGIGEIALALALVFGFMRKVSYISGIVLSLVIWTVPEGFGGPYGSGSSDIGTGIVYSFVFLLLLVINASFGPSKYSIDARIERRFAPWKKVAETKGICVCSV